MSEPAGILPQIVMSFHYLEKKSIVQERDHTREDQQLVTSPPDFADETVRNSETDTSPVKTMTVLQSARPSMNTDGTTTRSMEGRPQKVGNPEGYVGSSGDTNIDV